MSLAGVDEIFGADIGHWDSVFNHFQSYLDLKRT
jgi:hypothetical protein